MINRNRKVYLFLLIVVVLLGLASRKLSEFLPEWLANYSGDTLWALMIFLMLGIFFSNKSTVWVGGSALALSFIIESSQLYHAPWIDGIRNTTLGALVLGFGFLWTDLVCYTIGVGIGVLIDKYLNK